MKLIRSLICSVILASLSTTAFLSQAEACPHKKCKNCNKVKHSKNSGKSAKTANPDAANPKD